jgi:hypothetical protein
VHGLLQDIRRECPGFAIATTPAGLSRGGIFSAEMLVILLLNLVADGGKHGYQILLDGVWERALAADVDLPSDRVPAAASFCNARQRLRPEVLSTILRRVAGTALARRGTGRRFFAVDGSRQHVQRSEELWRTCGGPSNSNSPLVQVSVLFDLDDEIPLNVEVGPFAASEREQCLAHLAHLRKGDVLVLDRGYPGFGLLWELMERGIDFVVRTATSSTFPAVERFVRSGRTEAEIEIAPGAAFKRSHPPEQHRTLLLRAVRLKGRGRQVTVLLTTLRGAGFSRDQLAAIYRRRWRIEEYFKLVKSRHFGAGQLHAKSFAGVQQEILAQALYVTITRFFSSATHASSPRARTPVHVKAALHIISTSLVELLLADDRTRLTELIIGLTQRIRRRTQPPRPGRQHPRRSFLPCSKWCSKGRRGRRER